MPIVHPPLAAMAASSQRQPAAQSALPDNAAPANDGEDAPDRELHRAVREAFRDAMRNGASQRHAFDAATELVSAQRPLSEPDARRLVARMLACEPRPPRATG